jgi:hypothetical protein
LEPAAAGGQTVDADGRRALKGRNAVENVLK